MSWIQSGRSIRKASFSLAFFPIIYYFYTLCIRQNVPQTRNTLFTFKCIDIIDSPRNRRRVFMHLQSRTNSRSAVCLTSFFSSLSYLWLRFYLCMQDVHYIATIPGNKGYGKEDNSILTSNSILSNQNWNWGKI